MSNTSESSPRKLRGLVIGAGYFSDFHLDAWSRIDGVEIIAICDLDLAKAERAATKFAISRVSTDAPKSIRELEIDFVDIATPPSSHLALIETSIEAGRAMICQKPLASDVETSNLIIDRVRAGGVKLMVHENFRFQPWYREIKRLLDDGVIGDRVHQISLKTRMGDGWQKDAYLARQPYFRTMPRLLVHETGVHFVDTFRYLAGEIRGAHAILRRRNEEILGEDAGVVMFDFESGAIGVWDASRYNESTANNPRYTFGNLCIDASGGSIWLDDDGGITIKRLGDDPVAHPYHHRDAGFAGDCVLAAQRHFVGYLRDEHPCETSIDEYAKTLQVVQQIYQSASWDTPARWQRGGCDIIDLTLPINDQLPGANVETAKTIASHGWNATTLKLYSHSGTHMDAPRHFLNRGLSMEQLHLDACVGPATLVDLTPVQPRELLTSQRIVAALGGMIPSQRLILRTDWHRRFGTDEYRNALPRISAELAHWLVRHEVRLIGVEPPSVADVNNIAELTEVHTILLRAGIVIVEGLANLDKIHVPSFEFIALPLCVVGGDGCPVRAIARVGDARVTRDIRSGVPLGFAKDES